MKFNFWKFGTFVICSFLLVGLGVLLAQTFGGNLPQQSNSVANSSEIKVQQNSAPQNVASYPEYTRPTDTVEANISQPQNKDWQKQSNLASSKQKRKVAQPPIYFEQPQIVEQPQPRFTVDELKSRVINESEAVVTNLLGYTSQRNIRSLTIGTDKYDAPSLTYQNIAYDSKKRVVNCTIYFRLKNESYNGVEYAVDWSSRMEARDVSCF